MDTSKIKEQLEFYFGDSNYAKDRFMQETAAKNNKCIPVSVLLTFKRLKNLNATPESIIKAAKESSLVEVVEESLKKIETKEYIAYREDQNIAKRVVHMSGFDTELTLDELQDILREHCAPVKIVMRRNKDKKFTGSCFVELSSEEKAAEALLLKIECNSPVEEDIAKEEPKKQKKEEKKSYIKIITKEAYLAEKPEKVKESSNERFIEKIKADFVPKLYTYETAAPLSIADIKAVLPNVAFVDTNKKVIRMKFREEWTEKEAGADDKKLVLTKMTEDAAKEYVASLNIKKVPKKK